MGDWIDVITQSDIDELLDAYGGFHDSCITNLTYVSGASVDENSSMIFGALKDRKVSVTFKRQWSPASIELLFEGVRRMNIAGWQNNYFCEILDCYLAFHSDLVKGLDNKLIVWADDHGFRPKADYGKTILQEPMTTYIIAENLKWRLLPD